MKGSARGSVHWGCDEATFDIEVYPQRRCFCRRHESDFALQALVECLALEPERVADRLCGIQVRRGLAVGL